jgi:hypothetical protein
MMLPIYPRGANGETVCIRPGKLLAVVAEGTDASRVWHLTIDGFLEEVAVRAEASHIRVALGLDDDDCGDVAPLP